MTKSDLPQRRFYVYVYFRDGEPIYVGKGAGQRIYQHSSPGRGNAILHRIIEKDRFEGTKRVTKRKVAENLTEDDAFALERSLIAQHGRRPAGLLVNFTDGGEGASNPTEESRLKKGASIRRSRENGRVWTVSAEQRVQISAALTGRKRDPAATAKAVAKQTGKKRTPEQRARMSEAQKGNTKAAGRVYTPEQREHLRAVQIGRKMKPEWIEKSAAANRGRKRTPEQRVTLSASLKGIPKSPEHRQATRQAMLGREIKPEWIAKKKARAAATRATRTHCAKGHAYADEGGALTNGRGNLICRSCRRLSRAAISAATGTDFRTDMSTDL